VSWSSYKTYTHVHRTTPRLHHPYKETPYFDDYKMPRETPRPPPPDAERLAGVARAVSRFVRTPSPPHRGLVLKEPTPRLPNIQVSHHPVSARQGEGRERATPNPSASAPAPAVPRPAPAEIMDTSGWHSLFTQGAGAMSKVLQPQSSGRSIPMHFGRSSSTPKHFGRAIISEGFGQYCFAPRSQGTGQSACCADTCYADTCTSRDIALLRNLAEVDRLKAALHPHPGI
jgi:hypothetical protein